ncbi:hypothetical protein OIU85_002872 [Salix viminalis]|uniref:Uncharacterized protein n=1 Tax=Salix viminalis TaxID=40686 RepID=A0A9Q0VPP3_SALVM|nr:hypothetical protein OIU85_002872 [Salix viminalis]
MGIEVTGLFVVFNGVSGSLAILQVYGCSEGWGLRLSMVVSCRRRLAAMDGYSFMDYLVTGIISGSQGSSQLRLHSSFYGSNVAGEDDLSRNVMVGEPKENVELLIGTVVTW